MRLEGKVALISGAARGMGAEEARLFAREGAKVVLGDVLDEAGKAVATAIRASGDGAIYRSLDVTDQAAWAAAVEAAESDWGRLDILVNNAGVTSYSKGDKDSLEDFDRCHEINSRGSYLGIRASIPAMRRAGGGSIVNISSISSLKYLSKPYVAYYSTKAAMNHMTRVTAAEYASQQVRVNAVVPGLMDTPMARISAERNWGATPEKMAEYWKARAAQVSMGWLGDAFDIAKAAAFLASSEARWITGQALVVDGGTTLGL